MEDLKTLDELTKKLANYSPSSSALQLVRSTPIVLLVGVSGAGKDTIKQRILQNDEYYHIVSHTTRPPRINKGVKEVDGIDYHFITRQAAGIMLDHRDFIEAKLYSGNLYGTSVGEIQTAHDNKKIAITDLEVQGVVEYKTIDPAVRAIFILPPNYQEWQARLQQRYNQTVLDSADYRKRMRTAEAELSWALSKDYFDFILNDDLDKAVAEVEGLAAGVRPDAYQQAAIRAAAERLHREIADSSVDLS